MAQYSRHFNTTKTSQTTKIPGTDQVPNYDGGYVWKVDCWKQLERFLILGTEGGSYYVGEKELTVENANSVMDCIQTDGIRVVNTLVDISTNNRAPKNDSALFVLAMCAKFGNEVVRSAAYAALPKVARTSTHMFSFRQSLTDFGIGGGSGAKRAFQRWYQEKSPSDIAYQLIKYKNRGGWSHRDVLRLARPFPKNEQQRVLFRYAVSGDICEDECLAIISAAEELHKDISIKDKCNIIEKYRMPWEAIPTELLKEPRIWKTLLPNMGLTAMIRSLNKMTAYGVLKSGTQSDAGFVCDAITSKERLIRERIHPAFLLTAAGTYLNGCGDKGKLTWDPVTRISNALEDAFYLSFPNVKPTGKRIVFAVDGSMSMTYQNPVSCGRFDCRASALAMALVTMNVEKSYELVAFSSKLGTTSISPRMRIADACKAIEKVVPAAYTDCSLPMTWAEKNKIEADVFILYTDSCTNTENSTHPCQALRNYRASMGIPSKMVVVGMVSNPFTIADPNDSGTLDVVGFDSSVPSIISDFAV